MRYVYCGVLYYGRRSRPIAAAAVDDRCGSRNSPNLSPNQSECRRNMSAFIRPGIITNGMRRCFFVRNKKYLFLLPNVNNKLFALENLANFEQFISPDSVCRF